ncbi:MAG: aspartate/glutamate racemase family protein [Propionibacteriaceae bacterium]|nr:aspartate/glutamate racemase family protein [Propionibacteriaceae bacterium]
MTHSSPWGHLAQGAPLGQVRMARGQALSGYRIGVIHIEDVWYPLVPGNVVNAHTFDFPVRLKPVRGLSVAGLFGADSVDVGAAVLEACAELVDEGVWAISAACGFFGRYQVIAQRESPVPVALSSLVQLPWLRAICPPGKIAVLTADSASLDADMLAACGVADTHDLLVGGLQAAPQFSAILQGRGEFDNEAVRAEVVAQAVELCADPDVTAVLLECSDMPPYAAAVQAATGKPVFDFTTLIRFLASSVSHRPYAGFI